MGTIQIQALVINEQIKGESDKRITVIAKDMGKLQISVRGGRKPGSKFLAASQLFSYGNFVLYKGRGFYSMSQAELLESFTQQLDTYEKLSYGAYCLELADKLILENQPVNKVLALMLKTLVVFGKGRLEEEAVSAVFTLKLLQILGYEPELSQCVVCGCNLDEKARFSPGKGGMVCNLCSRYEGIALSPPAIEALRFVLGQEEKNVYNFKISQDTTGQLKQAALSFLFAHHDVQINAQKVIGSLKK